MRPSPRVVTRSHERRAATKCGPNTRHTITRVVRAKHHVPHQTQNALGRIKRPGSVSALRTPPNHLTWGTARAAHKRLQNACRRHNRWCRPSRPPSSNCTKCRERMPRTRITSRPELEQPTGGLPRSAAQHSHMMNTHVDQPSGCSQPNARVAATKSSPHNALRARVCKHNPCAVPSRKRGGLPRSAARGPHTPHTRVLTNPLRPPLMAHASECAHAFSLKAKPRPKA